MIRRTLEKKLKELARSFSVVTVTGPRQSGKTTLVRSAFPQMSYVSLEDLDSREFAEDDPRGFLATYEKGAVIDEAQRVPALFSYIQGKVDEANRPGMYVLSGSQNFLLHERISQSLAGRVGILNLLPLSIEELGRQAGKRSRYEDFLFSGFYPRLYDRPVAPLDWYPAYIQTYVERDLRLIKNVTDLASFQRFIRLCAGRIGQILNLSSLAIDCGISHNTAKSWLSVLEASFILYLLKPHYRNFSKRLIKMPKLYFVDPGLACFLLGISSPGEVDSHHLKGGLFESMIVSELLKYRLHRGFQPGCYLWRDKTGHEV
ncbi:MAG: ATP-binding protein, partial [Desulfobacterota bacterium]|nr:ATP-binding protein [Thermodesulfobacteriota bacterium]